MGGYERKYPQCSVCRDVIYEDGVRSAVGEICSECAGDGTVQRADWIDWTEVVTSLARDGASPQQIATVTGEVLARVAAGAAGTEVREMLSERRIAAAVATEMRQEIRQALEAGQPEPEPERDYHAECRASLDAVMGLGEQEV